MYEELTYQIILIFENNQLKLVCFINNLFKFYQGFSISKVQLMNLYEEYIINEILFAQYFFIQSL